MKKYIYIYIYVYVSKRKATLMETIWKPKCEKNSASHIHQLLSAQVYFQSHVVQSKPRGPTRFSRELPTTLNLWKVLQGNPKDEQPGLHVFVWLCSEVGREEKSATPYSHFAA